MAKKEKEEIERIVYAPEMFQKCLLFIVLLIARYDKRRFSQFKKLPLPINLLNLQVICWRKGIQRANVKLHLRRLQSIGLVEELRREDGVPFYGVNEVAYMRYLWQFAERHYYQTLEALLDDIYNDTFLETTGTLWDCEFPSLSARGSHGMRPPTNATASLSDLGLRSPHHSKAVSGAPESNPNIKRPTPENKVIEG